MGGTDKLLRGSVEKTLGAASTSLATGNVELVEDKEEDTGTDEDDEEEDEANGVIFVVFILVGFSFLTVLILLII
jgi:hypothetical protein